MTLTLSKTQPLTIIMVVPLFLSVPPVAYGGIELVVYYLIEELCQRGYHVILVGTGDSKTSADLIPCCLQSLGTEVSENDYFFGHIIQMKRLRQICFQYKNAIIHSHLPATAGKIVAKIAKENNIPVVTTLHAPIGSEDIEMAQQYPNQTFCSISYTQRQPAPQLGYFANVYNAINAEAFQFHPEPENLPYLAFLGRMSPEKGPHHAINIAKQTGSTLKMAGKINPVDRAFFEREIRPQIDHQQIQFFGEADHNQKNALMGGAIATLFPITWSEPYGLVMIESLASGTPVIAMKMGSVPEVIAHGQTGLICNTVEDCVASVSKVEQLSRQTCRSYVEQTFNVQRMTDGYEAVYSSLLPPMKA